MFTGQVTLRRLRWLGPLVVVISLAVNLLIRALSLAIFKPSSAFSPLGIGPVSFWSIVLGCGAVIVFGLVGRFSSNPTLTFLIIALIVYIAAFVPDLVIISSNPPPFLGTTPIAVGTLLAMHAIEAAITICMLLLLGFDKNAARGKTSTG